MRHKVYPSGEEILIAAADHISLSTPLPLLPVSTSPTQLETGLMALQVGRPPLNLLVPKVVPKTVNP